MLELATNAPPEAVFARDSSIRCTRQSSQAIAWLGASPIAIGALAASAAVVSVTVTLIGAIVMLAILIAAQRRSCRRAIGEMLAWRVRRRAHVLRERNRRRQLRVTGLACHDRYHELRRRIVRITRTRCPIAEKLELEGLLDHHVQVAVAQELYSNAMSRSRECEPSYWPHEAITSRRAQIMARRAEHRSACRRRADELSDELDAIDELVALVEQRVACPDAAPDRDAAAQIEWRLSRLDELDTALHEVSAICDPDVRAIEAR